MAQFLKINMVLKLILICKRLKHYQIRQCNYQRVPMAPQNQLYAQDSFCNCLVDLKLDLFIQKNKLRVVSRKDGHLVVLYFLKYWKKSAF